MTRAWIDCSAGVAGDMLLAALVDAGAALPAVRAAVEAVVPGEVALACEEVRRAGLRAAYVTVSPARHDHAHRTWHDVRGLLTRAELPAPVRENALAVFARLAAAEARVHGTAVDDVHFHEVGAWDSIADVVGTCAAVHDLGVTGVTASPIAVGSGRVHTAHGELPVPAPAVAELCGGWRVFAGGDGELATPTGVALVTTLARTCAALSPMRLHATGVGAGTRDVPGRPNVVRVLLGAPDEAATASAVLLESNVDDLDPRAWPSVLTALLDAGAHDAWLVPVLMKKGRPAHTLSVLAPANHTASLRDAVFRLTSTLGVREHPVTRSTLARGWTHVAVHGTRLPVKVGHRDGTVVQATPEYADAAELAAARALPVHVVLTAATTAAHNAGLTPGASLAALGITLDALPGRA
ncbi:nickel pincer cofactor biosynthesis protein LarC [Yinghuangia sp. ASG 101]|uniref:nickel pincer cofactor biosynthesis protein LarC n=1 Tax=Yinghuangia sp. ASG 101 TaxID=2896848 RepID=UPI001E57D20F|nr:nickel pincer cofactor biosynthesis protein LarC [Yinghuangia sp. ASG 101]UGQ13251.1 nickel pincer cofactor biosynthesis protein LarC [Yinghuangia sp. ASG 101]